MRLQTRKMTIITRIAKRCDVIDLDVVINQTRRLIVDRKLSRRAMLHVVVSLYSIFQMEMSFVADPHLFQHGIVFTLCMCV